MNKQLFSKLINYIKNISNKTKYRIIFITLSIVVILGTAYTLMQPAITSAAPITDIPIYSVNYYNNSGNLNSTIIVYNNSDTATYQLKELITTNLSYTMDFAWWKAVTVDLQHSTYVVTNIANAGTGISKDTLSIQPKGFMVLVFSGSDYMKLLDQVSVGMHVTISDGFDITTLNYSTDASLPLGTLSFINGTNKPPIQNTIPIVQSADTKDFIEVNLYDYGTNINDNYKNNNKYPGFQQPGGTTKFWSNNLNANYFNFGDNITNEIKDIVNTVTHNTSPIDINYTNPSTNGGPGINQPIPRKNSVMNKSLYNGYPAIVNGNEIYSLDYLFNNSVKKNNDNINGLFQYNEQTGAYTYNSRENHAQFNSTNNTFTLYQARITSNFMMYPFGNFLPFNNIETQTTQASVVNREYFVNISDYALYKSIYGDVTLKTEYSKLSTALIKFVELMDDKYSTNWNYQDAMREYFELSKIDTDIDAIYQVLNSVYSIDYDEKTDFFFGLDMKMNFMQPKNGYTGPNGTEPMIFEFTGDDDVWVYIDNMLFLDLSGIHRHVGGKIDFVKGQVCYSPLTVSEGDVSNDETDCDTFTKILKDNGYTDSQIAEYLVQTGTDSNGNPIYGTFKDYSTHSFNFYYMERGAGSGVMRMNFNFPLLKQNSIYVTKELNVDDGTYIGNPDFMFQILNVDNFGNPTTPLITKDTPDSITYEIYENYYTNNKRLIANGLAKDIVDENSIFKLKAGQTIVFNGIEENTGKHYVREILDPDWVNQYQNVTINGIDESIDQEITIDSNTFIGVESGIRDISNGSTAFTFKNNVSTNKYGSLQIIKKLESNTIVDINEQFEFKITLDGNNLPSEYEYTVTKVDGSQETRKVSSNSTITISPNETATIKNILAGSYYEVKEIISSSASNNGYTIKYNGQVVESAKGYITADSQASPVIIEIINIEKSDEIVIPITKTLINPDGSSQSYQFELQEITNENGSLSLFKNDLFKNNTFSIEGQPQKLSTQNSSIITINFDTDSPDKQSNSFTISYNSSDYEAGTTIHYYEIKEIIPDENDDSTEYDKTIYKIEVTVTKESDETLYATITNVWKNNSIYTGSELEFINTLYSSLILTKTVEGITDTNGQFKFYIRLNKKDDTPLIIGELTTPYSCELKNIDTKDSSNCNLTFDDTGQAIIYLKHHDIITIKNLPSGIKYQITEEILNGYIVKHRVNSDTYIGTEVNDNLTKGENQIEFINISGYELPATGSSGMLILIIVGSLLLIVPIIYIGYMLYKRGKEGELTS